MLLMCREMACPVIFWCADEQKLEWLLNFDEFKFKANFVLKRLDSFFFIKYLDFSRTAY